MSMYLLLYNCIQFCGWCFFLAKVALDLIDSKSIEEIFSDTHIILEFCQYGAFLEIIHAILGIVKTRLLPTVMQISVRIFIVILLQFVPSSVSNGYLLIWFAWSSIEVVRYSFYALKLLQKDANSFNIPYFLTWCRYTFFIWLYPFGSTGEMMTIWNAQKDCSKYILWKNNDISISAAMLFYPLYILFIPTFICMYGYLFNLRKRVLYRLNNDNINIKKNE